MRIESLYLYPIKSCAPVWLFEARCTREGISIAIAGSDDSICDRSFAVVDMATKEVMTQRKLPRMATIQPLFEMASTAPAQDTRGGATATSATMFLDAPGMPQLAIPLSIDRQSQQRFIADKTGSVHLHLNTWLMAGAVPGADDDIASSEVTVDWLSAFFAQTKAGHGRRFGLVRLDPNREVHVVKGFDASEGATPGPRLLIEQMAGEVAEAGDSCTIQDWAPYLITNSASLDDLNVRLPSKHPVAM